MGAVLNIIANGAWDGGIPVDNSVYENIGMFFKRGIPVNHQTIEERIGIRQRIAAPLGEKIGVTALKHLLDTGDIDPSKIKLVIGATNIGEDKYDPGPVSRHPFAVIEKFCPDATVLDLYAGCPGFNVAVELIFMLSLSGGLNEGDLSVVVGAENLHRAKVFRPLDTSNIIFGDDAMATALQTVRSVLPEKGTVSEKRAVCAIGKDFVGDIAQNLFELMGDDSIDGLIVDNQLGQFLYRVPATAARVQHRLVELIYPQMVSKGIFKRFKDALNFYDTHVKSFAFDIMTLKKDGRIVSDIAKSYVTSGRYKTIAAVFLGNDLTAEISLFKGQGYEYKKPSMGVVDTITRTHGCFAHYIQAILEDGDVVGEIDGKGVFLHATRGAKAVIYDLLSGNGLTMDDIDLLIEHQANFAMIPLTLEQILDHEGKNKKQVVGDYIAQKMVTNIHERGNCSVVCMQRLPYDLERDDVYRMDILQGYRINENISRLKEAGIILSDSVGSGMTRSAFLQIKNKNFLKNTGVK